MSLKNIWLIDFSVAIPVFTLAAYMGCNIVISFVFAGLAASLVNIMGAAGVFRRKRS